MNKTEITPVQIAIRIVIIIIVIAVLLLISFGLVRLVPKIVSSLGGIRGLFAPKERLEVTLGKKTITQQEDTLLTYKQINGKNVGSYTINYSCANIAEDTRLEVSQDDESKVIECDRPLVIGTTASTSFSRDIVIRPISDNISYNQTFSITVTHINASSTVAIGSATLTVLGEEKLVTIATSSAPIVSVPTKTISKPVVHTAPSQPSHYSSLPVDLSVTIGQVSVDQNSRASLTFYVTNNGGQNSGLWKFRADLPREIGQTNYNSPYQTSIPPHKTSIMYLSFGNAVAGNINIFVDDTNTVRESNESNNWASVTLK